MRKLILLGTLAAAGGAACAADSYSLAIPTAPVIRVAASASADPWLASNYVASVSSSFAPIGATTAAVSESVLPGHARYALAGSEAGFPVQRIQPQLWLAEALPEPEGVDWNSTYDYYNGSTDEQGNFIFDNKALAVYTQTGGNLTFAWVLGDGTTNEMTYVVSGNVKGRPYRLFWTESPWNSPEISLAGKYVKLFGPESLIKPQYGEVVSEVGGKMLVETNVVVRGVYYDKKSETLAAYGQVSGQFVLGYYDTGSYTTLKQLQVIEVGEPTVLEMSAHIGEPVVPYATGYNPDGLVASPIKDESAATDEFGDYYYQHSGMYSYSPKNGDVFPLRDTLESPWRIDVYWMESDSYGVQWPFERCQYAAGWNTEAAAILIAGDHVKIPSEYNVELNKYQTPNGHAHAPVNNLFSSASAGLSCLKLGTSDNVFFQTVRTVERTDTNCFTLAEEDWRVGSELVPRGGGVSGTAEGFNPVVDYTVSGYLDLAHSGRNYNPRLYYDWTTAESNEYASVIYGVNASDEALEVHWYMTVKQDGMPSQISFPCLAQRYRIHWPDVDQAPQVVIASVQGGLAESVYENGNALYFSSGESRLALPSTRCFNERGGAVAFWADASEVATNASGRVLTLGADVEQAFSLQVDAAKGSDGSVVYTLACGTNGVSASVSTAPVADTKWHRIVFALDGTNWTSYVDGVACMSVESAEMNYAGYLTGNSAGASDGAASLAGLALDEILVASEAPSALAVSNGLFSAEGLSKLAKMMVFEFPDGDLDPLPGSDVRYATDSVTGQRYATSGVLRLMPGAPTKGTGVFEADAMPSIYRQNDRNEVGYNPNEEHAFIGSCVGGYYVWAIRTDLNSADTSEPFALVEYERGGRKRMLAFPVLLTNDTYTALAGLATAGTVLPGPHPLDLFDNPWLTNDWWEVEDGVPTVAWPDRKNQIWARAAGILDIHMYYPNQDGFDYPSLASNPPLGTPIPWLACMNGGDALTGNPAPWRWNVSWPKNVETMRIGETLTKAANGLPEVWNATSMAVVWPDDGDKTVLLWDPTVTRTTGDASYGTPADLVEDFGFSVADGTANLRAGKYTFPGLPPSVSDRFFVNANLAPANCVCFTGVLESNAGGDLLWPNALNASEKDAIKALVVDSHPKKAKWDALVDKLPTTPVRPSVLGVQKADPTKPGVEYIARDHYAITAMGATNYVTIIENDAPVGGATGVRDGDAVSMHVFAVTNRLYAGRVITREDPLNMLSQQLGIIYTEAFAGQADDFVFEWKKAKPDDDGRMPTDYEGRYQKVFDPAAGLTRFTIGQQGDTLANLVNTFYVMRYRAKEGTPAYEVMGDEWSAWCGPALAEGWIQRCVNNVTPFTQRVTDLYANAAETWSTMIQAAGKPWAGDVALSQDNLTEVGLIELYQTLLNKAESMSLSVGLNDTDANKQLLLAAERLADMYMVLGNEAYSDALNPTIGFGAAFGKSGGSIDYGAESTGLFCFDNQVSSLLDEELALLRGRTGVNNPSVTAAPFYNRLVWNFTRGITAGEVAYAMNYNVYSSNNDAKIDENDAALMYPQGHGDAYGHYLSALSVWYRLLRNPNFSWSTSMMQMNVADNVVDVDYFDEERFSEIAAKLADTSAEVVDRTVKKAWRENGRANGAGYFDDDGDRAFGYGEWATRGGVGAVMNWMVANSMLPAAESSGQFQRLKFDGSTMLSITNVPVGVVLTNLTWTFEFQANAAGEERSGVAEIANVFGELIVADELPMADSGEPYMWENFVSISSDENGGISASLRRLTALLVSSTVTHTVTTTNLLGDAFDEDVEYSSYDFDYRVDNLVEVGPFATMPSTGPTLFAVDSDRDGGLRLRVFGPDGALLGSASLGTAPIMSPRAMLGLGFRGYMTEMRFWSQERSDDEIIASREYVNPRTESLATYTRGVSEVADAETLPDETPGGDCPWMVFGGDWLTVEESGFGIAFEDDGLLRINRATATSLETLASAASAIQKQLDKADSGLNPIGLSDSAIPFDIAPGDAEDDADDAHSHFEQIAARAETALENAAKVLDRAQEASKHIRQISNNELAEEEQADESERAYNARLIEIYGMPYADDIGPSGTYPQGYAGPDLYHYMYMDLEAYGLTGAEVEPVAVVTYSKDTDKWTYDSMKAFLEDTSVNSSTKNFSYQLTASGLVKKPASFTGRRQCRGKIQDAYNDYILAYVALKNAVSEYNAKVDKLSQNIKWIDDTRSAAESSYDATLAKAISKFATDATITAMKDLSISMKLMAELAKSADAYVDGVSAKTAIGIGLTSMFVPGAVAYGAAGGFNLGVLGSALGWGAIFDGIAVQAAEVQNIVDTAALVEQNSASWTTAKKSAYEAARGQIGEISASARQINVAWATMVAAAERFDTVVAEGDRVQAERESVRAKLSNRIIRQRYNDMFFRNVRDYALTRYSAAFDLAQKYVFMAAQAYDYETGLLSADRMSGDKFKGEIVGARSIGKLDASGKPVLGGGYGDAGLADVLARMKANYIVLKPRLGINNPDRNATWFSLRRELFRIDPGAAGDASWRKELSKYVVDDLRTVPEYVRFCQPVASTSPLEAKESALVIPFSSTIDFAKNFFGKDLKAGDHALDSSYYATKIHSAGVKFEGYSTAALSRTPVVYLVPAGVDSMRVPGGSEKGTVLSYNVLDQVIPVPYSVGSAELDDEDWTPTYTGYTAGGDVAAKIRRIPSFRAMIGEEDDADRANRRLIGRSAWNTRWVVIIPAGQLLGGSAEDRKAALDAFIYGSDLNRDGIVDAPGVADIKLGLKTYSHSGN
ncbi:MAG: hypothetical protein K6G91_05925 [Kiritimatiellae bacterium]|nr:hypothetical protein [Kiritimatiellia bacterium]